MKFAVAIFLTACTANGWAADGGYLHISLSDDNSGQFAHFRVTDPLGRMTGQGVQQIPSSSYGIESIGDDVSGDPSDAITVFDLRMPMAGTYSVTVISSSNTHYLLGATSADSAGTRTTPLPNGITGSLAPGTSTQFLLIYDPTPGSQLVVRPVIDISPLDQNRIGSCAEIKMGGNARSAGPVRVNGIADLSGNARIIGDLTAASLQTAGNARVEGQVTQASGTLNCFPIDVGSIGQLLSASNDNGSIPSGFLSGGTLRVAGNSTLSLSSGSYIVDRLEVSGNAKLRASGAVNLFVRQAASFSGNSETGVADAALNILVASSSNQALSGKSVRATLYAPNAKVLLSGNTLFTGNLHAGRVELSGNAKVEAP